MVSTGMMVLPMARQQASAGVVCRSSRCGSRWVALMMGRVTPTMTSAFHRRRPLVSVDRLVMLVMLVLPLCVMMLVMRWLPHLLLLVVVLVRRRSLTLMALLRWVLMLMLPLMMMLPLLRVMRSLLRVMVASAAALA